MKRIKILTSKTDLSGASFIKHFFINIKVPGERQFRQLIQIGKLEANALIGISATYWWNRTKN